MIGDQPFYMHIKIKKKEKYNYLCNDKIQLGMVLGCIYVHILITCLYRFRRDNRMRNTWCMSPMYFFLHGEILRFA